MRWGERNELVCCSTAPRPALPLAGQGQARQDRVWTDLDAGNAGSGVDKGRKAMACVWEDMWLVMSASREQGAMPNRGGGYGLLVAQDG